MRDIQQHIEQLRAEIAGQQAVLADLEAETLDLHRELDEFKIRYDKIVLPISTRLDAAQAAVAELEAEQKTHTKDLHFGNWHVPKSEWTPPEGYVSVEEQFRRLWETPPEDDNTPPESPETAPPKPRRDAADDRETRIKRLYRSLARRFHPDLATDPADREYRTELMARINEAYSARDLAALQALADQPDNVDAKAPLAALQMQELQQIKRQLGQRISALRIEIDNLMHGDLLRLKLEAKLARGQGRNLLRELAAQMERDYTACMTRLDQLRQKGK